jgi:hypothetical protein
MVLLGEFDDFYLQKVFNNKGILIRSVDVRVQQLAGATAAAATMTATRTNMTAGRQPSI